MGAGSTGGLALEQLGDAAVEAFGTTGSSGARWQRRQPARVGAAVTMRVGDFFQHRKRLWLRLHEKGGKRHEVPCHPTLEGYLDAYIKALASRETPRDGFSVACTRGTSLWARR